MSIKVRHVMTYRMDSRSLRLSANIHLPGYLQVGQHIGAHKDHF
jgi:hypothetical protein